MGSGLFLLSGCQGLTGNTKGSGNVTVGSATLDFGSVLLGTTKTLSDTLTNNTSSAVTISSVVGIGTGFQLSGITLPLTVAAGQTVSFSVQFQPADAGDPTVTIAFDEESSQQPVVSVTATGTGSSAGQINFTPSPLTFGNVIAGSSKTVAVTLSNSGGSDLQITKATLSGAGFAISNMALPFTLSVGKTTSVSITFAPTAAGNFSGSVNFATNSQQLNSNFVLSISGVGAGSGTLVPNPSSLAFGSVQVGSNSSKTETLTNSGSTTVTISQATASGAGFSISGLSLPATLAANQTVNFTSTFTPTTAGAASGSISITSDATNSPLAIALSGTGLALGSLTANPSTANFGSVTDGTNKTVPVVVTNNGGTAVTVSSASVSGSAFSFTGPSLPATINAGQTATFNAAFAPTASGAASGTLTITSNASNATLSVPLSGTGVSQGQLESSPSSFSFGSVQDGTSKSLSGTLTNSGGSSLTISAATASGTGFTMSGLSLPLILNAGQSTSFTVLFSPTISGAASGSVAITSNGSNANLSIPLTGTGVTQGTLAANPTSLSFGSVQTGKSTNLSETLTNSGGSSLTISAAAASGSGYTISGLSLPVTLNAGQSTSFTVTFAPTASGVASGTVAITSNGSNPSLSISLTGTGVTQGSLAANPTSLAFGNIQVGKSTTLSETVTNSGGSSLTISAAAASGAGYSISGLSLPVTLNAGQSASFTVTFAPTASGAASGGVAITSNATDPNLSIPLSGTGVTQGALTANPTSLAFGNVQVSKNASLSETLTNSGGSSLTISAASASGSGYAISGLALPVTLNAGQSTSFSVTFAPTTSGAASGTVSVTSDGSNPTLTIPLSGSGVTQGALTANPTSLAFGNIQVGNNASLSETLTNSGGSSLTISAASASGSGYSLSGLSLPLTLNAGQSTSLTVTFTPTASGAASGNVNITSNASNSTLTVALSGTGVSQGSLTANPTSLAFGSILTGGNKGLSETLTNSGGSSLTISAASASGTGYTLSGLSLPLTLTAGQSTSFTVTFAPTVSGAATGNVSITSNASNPSLSIALSGTGVAPGTLSANPSSLGFGNIQVGSSASLSETVSNTGGSSVTISSASLSSGVFTISGLNLPTTLAAGQSVTFTLIFAPTSATGTSGTLSVISNATNSTLSVALTGTGTALGTLAVSPGSLSFGNVAVGSNSSLAGSLTAGGAAVTVLSASSTNSEFVISGISLPATLNAGQSASFTVTFTPQASGATSATVSFASNATNSPASQTMTGTGTSPVSHSVDLTWGASANAVGYNIYRGTVSGGPYTMINGSLNGSTAYTDSTVVSGTTYYYVATSVDSSSNESGYSNQAQAVIP